MDRIKPMSVKALDNYILEIQFSNGETRKFDCIPYINGDWYSELVDLQKFNAVRISHNTVEWSTRQDICPDCLYDNSYF